MSRTQRIPTPWPARPRPSLARVRDRAPARHGAVLPGWLLPLRWLPLRWLPLLGLLGVLLPGCGEPPARDAAAPAEAQPVAGQEVWVPYDPPSDTPTLSPHLRPMAAARALAEGLRAEALAGADVGAMARRHSGAPSSVGDGLLALPLRLRRSDERDAALRTVALGGVTALLDWQSGFWFARRIDLAQAARLQPLLEAGLASEVRGQAIVISHKEAWPWRHDARTTREQARQRAEAVLARARAGADFEALAREASDDLDSSARGGWLWAYDPATGRASTPWVRWGCRDFPVSVVNHLLRGELGQTVPEVLDTLVGYVVVRPAERRPAGTPPGAGR